MSGAMPSVLTHAKHHVPHSLAKGHFSLVSFHLGKGWGGVVVGAGYHWVHENGLIGLLS